MGEESAYFVPNLSYRKIVDESEYLVLAKDLKGKYLKVNDAVLKSLNVTLSQMVGKTDFDIFPNNPLPAVWEERDLQVMQLNQTVNNEDLVEVVGKEGEKQIQYYSTTRFPLKDDSGNIIGMWGLSHDVTHLRESVNTILKMEAERLREISKTKSQFLANMSHEIRTPLNSIMGNAALLRFEIANEPNLEYVRGIESSCRGLLALLDDIIDITKLEKGTFELYFSEFDLADFLDEIRMLFSPIAKHKKIKFQVNPCDNAKTIKGDLNKMRKIMSSIVDNAIKFTPESGSVSVQSLAKPTSVTFIIQDSGIGINDDKLKTIFEPFTQVDSSITRQHEGSGLGLSISKGLVELLKGKIKITSQIGIGTKVVVDIPVEFVQKKDKEINQLQFAEEFKSLNILAVDDNSMNLRIVAKLLEKVGHKVTTAINGLKALELVKTGQFDFVFMDIFMPLMDGYEATKEIRKLNKPLCDIPVVALTANATKSARQESLDAGLDDYLSKPISLKALLEKIKLHPYNRSADT